VVQFKSDSTTLTPLKAEILTNGFTYTIYPDPVNSFWFNFKSIKSIELNVGNYAETLDPDLNTAYVYNWTSKAILEETLTFTIFYTNDTNELITKPVIWLNGYVNLIDYKRNLPNYFINPTNVLLLKPLPLVKYWAGLPFDLTIYNSNTSNIKLRNNTNGVEHTFSTGYKVPRLFFSDGDSDTTIEDVVPFVEGFNKATISSGAGSYNFLVEKVAAHCGGHYLKWLNSFGGWSYWLFNKGNENITTKTMGVLNNDFNNLIDTNSATIALGTESSNSINTVQENITQDEMLILRDLLDSVKVYLFTGTPFTKSELINWVEVNINSGNFRLSNSREKLNTLSLTIDLPTNVTRMV
jgi:hypothetical protein